MTWPAIIVLAAGSYAFKLVGVTVLGGERATRLQAFTVSLPAALFAAIVVVQTVGGDESIVIDARVFGVVVAAVAVWRRMPFVVVVGLAMAATAALRSIS